MSATRQAKPDFTAAMTRFAGDRGHLGRQRADRGAGERRSPVARSLCRCAAQPGACRAGLRRPKARCEDHHYESWQEYHEEKKSAKPMMHRIRKLKATTAAGIYAKAAVVRASKTGAADLAMSLAQDLLDCPGLGPACGQQGRTVDGTAPLGDNIDHPRLRGMRRTPVWPGRGMGRRRQPNLFRRSRRRCRPSDHTPQAQRPFRGASCAGDGMSTIDNKATEISFGAAGMLCLGEDAEVRQGCAAMMAVFNGFWSKRRAPKVEEYEAACLAIERRAKVTAPIPATSRTGMVAKAEVVQRLSDLGMALYAVRIMASSLARDVLGSEER